MGLVGRWGGGWVLGAEAAGHRALRATSSFLWVLVGGRVSGLAEEGIARSEVPGQPVYRLSHPRPAPQCSDGDAHWQTGSSTSQSVAGTQWSWGIGWSPGRASRPDWTARGAGLCSRARPSVPARRPPGLSGRASQKQHQCRGVALMSATSGQHKP